MIDTARMTAEQINEFIEDLEEQLKAQTAIIYNLNERLSYAWEQNVEILIKYNSATDLINRRERMTIAIKAAKKELKAFFKSKEIGAILRKTDEAVFARFEFNYKKYEIEVQPDWEDKYIFKVYEMIPGTKKYLGGLSKYTYLTSLENIKFFCETVLEQLC